jgi:hypothetical protein
MCYAPPKAVKGDTLMYGMLLVELKSYVESQLGPTAWEALMEQTGGPRFYLPLGAYPDDEFHRLLEALAKALRNSTEATLEDFGAYLAPRLIHTYAVAIPPDWTALDLIAATPDHIYPVVRKKAGAQPPAFTVTRLDDHQLEVHYTSDRRLCWLAKGILRGIGAHYNQRLLINETACMSFDRPECSLHVRLSHY